MSGLIPFDFEGKKISVVTDKNDELWFVAMEVSSILEYTDSEAMTRRLDDDEKQNLRIVGFGPRGVTVISESGLYSAILGSNKPKAKQFKRWVTHEVLPSIRRTGGYQVGAAEKARLRHEGVGVHKAMKGMLVMRRARDGKGCAPHNFMVEAKLINHVLVGKFEGVDRDTLSLEQLDMLVKLELQNTILLGEGKSYADRKILLEQYAQSVIPVAPQIVTKKGAQA